MKKNLIFLLYIFSSSVINAQTPNYSEDIAEILYNNCTECHNEGGIAPFSLMTYQESSIMAPQIVLSIISGEMPPWPPDTNYQRYTHEKILTVDEINQIVNWNNNGVPEGDPNLAPQPPLYINGSKIQTPPDFTLELPIYSSNAYNNDDYVCFTETTTFNTDKWVKAIEIVPGNLSTVHHVLVYIDNNSTNGIISDCMGVDGELIAAYAPGVEPTIFPNGDFLKMGIKIPAGSKITSQIHYPIGSGGSLDSTKINFYFYNDNTNNIRQVFNEPILQNWNLYIPANTSPTYYTQYPLGNSTTDTSISVLSILPHMHLIGEEITTFSVNSNNDTIPLCKIPHWDFEWQGFYYFNNLLKIPSGSKLYSVAKYNNTQSNPHNPYNPPQLITAGENTTDEMFVVFLQYAIYEPGDENLVLNDLLSVGNANIKNLKTFKILPNPVTNSFWIELEIKENIKYTILDINGKIVQNGNLNNNKISVINLDAGQYFVYIIKDEIIYSNKFIKN